MRNDCLPSLRQDCKWAFSNWVGLPQQWRYAQVRCRMKIFRFAVVIGFSLMFTSCLEKFEPEASPAISLEPVSAQITGVVGELTESPPTVRAVRQSDGTPVSRVEVAFGFTSATQGGSIAARVDTTDALGIATAGTWRLGTRAGIQSLQASAFQRGASIVLSATARAAAPERFFAWTSLTQFALTGRTILPPSVMVMDVYNNGVAGVDVTFSAAQDGGSVGVASAKTNPSGLAGSLTWTIPAQPGSYRATATVMARAFEFSAVRIDSTTLVWYGLDSIVQPGRMFLPSGWGIRSARLGLSSFDPCLCVNLQGYFFETTDYGTTVAEYGGAFIIADGKASMTGADSVKVVGTSVLLKRLDYYSPAFYTWVYNRRN